jgi:hypothetical protein
MMFGNVCFTSIPAGRNAHIAVIPGGLDERAKSTLSCLKIGLANER